MTYVVTLVAAEGGLREADVASLATQWRARADWLAPGTACDLFCGAPPATTALPGIDVFIQPSATRRKAVVLADLESTLVTQEFLDELAAQRGLTEEVAKLTARAMRGEMDFAESFKARIALLHGTPRAAMEAVRNAMPFTPGASTLVATLKAHGIPTHIVSSGFTFLTGYFAERLGCADHEGNVAVFDNDVLAGVAEPVRDKHSKEAAVKAFADPATVAAVGDGANDLLMLQAAGAGFAYRAKPVVADAAQFNIRHGDLTAILYAFGFKSNEFVS